MIDKSAFFSATSRPTGVCHVEPFGSVPIQSLSMAQRMELPERIDAGQADALAWIVLQGVQGFDDDDLPAVANMAPEAMQTIVDAVLRLSGLSDEAFDAAKNG